MNETIYLALTAQGLTLTRADNPNALAQVAMSGDYVFDNNTEMTVRVTATTDSTTPDDPLHNLVFSLVLKDKIDGGIITTLTGRLFTGGGIEQLAELYSNNVGYISQKLDFYGALDTEYDFFEVVETRYDKAQKQAIIDGLTSTGVMNKQSDYRVKEVTLAVPATATDDDITPEQLRVMLLKALPQPSYLVMTDISSLPMIEAMASVMDKLNIHAFLDVGYMTDWRNVAALVKSLNLSDHRFRVLWNPNKSRPSNATSVLARQKWRPCVGDYLAKHLLRNALRDNNGIPPLHVPIAGYDFPLNFSGMKQLDEVYLDEEAQNALANAHVIVVLNERYQNQTRWVYADVLTQRNSTSSALRLGNAAEIETFTANGVIDIIKKHMLSPMSSYIADATEECIRFLDNCVARGLLERAKQLNNQYYALSITPRADKPFEAVDVKLARRPEGAVRQAYLETTINK